MSQFSSDELFRLDEIDRLRAELDEVYEANGKLAYLASQNDRLRAENDDLKAALDVWNSSELGLMIAKLSADYAGKVRAYSQASDEVERLLEVNEQLRTALEWYAKGKDGYVARAALNEETKLKDADRV